MLSSSKISPSGVLGDDWDSVINFESAAFDNGVDEGRRDANQSGEMYDNGVNSGFLKGFAYGLELGFMESVTAVSSIHAATDIKMPSLKNITNSSSDNHNGNSESSIISDTNLEAVNDEDSETKPDFQLRNSAIPVSNSRARKWCNEISTRARLAPDKNVDTFDFDKEVRELRALYKRCGSTVGPFRPHETMVNELSIDSIAYKSNEW